ncbi:MAG: FkbM family methyltransferase [Chitinispirillales bacterium]|jgi:hypothetical protein|nr:FkbM family methyltransferase [Chitinispirillales bacterium]
MRIPTPPSAQKSLVLQELEVLENFLRETPSHGIAESMKYISERVKLNIEKIKGTNEEILAPRFTAILESVAAKNQKQTTLIYMANDTRIKGGWVARLGAMLALYRIAKDNGFNFKINFTKPFKLLDFMTPNKYDWRIEEKDVVFSQKTISVSMLTSNLRYLYPETITFYDRSKFENFLIGLNGKYGQIQCHLDSAEPLVLGKFSELFNELFVLSDELKERIDFHKQKINGDYISVVFRFQSLLGDFEEYGYDALTKEKQNVLIEMCIKNLKVICDIEKGKTILVCSDSVRFRETVKDMENIYIVEGKRSHPNIDISNKETQMLSFIDFFLISFGQRTYCFAPQPLYRSGFPRIASMYGNIPFKFIEFDLTKPLLTRGNTDLHLKNNSIVLNWLKTENNMFALQEKEEIIECLNENPFCVFPYRYTKERVSSEAFYDKDNSMYFVLHNGKKMYFPHGWTEERVKNYYIGIMLEQNRRSPHCYIADGFEVKENDVIADIGAAEGIWALDNVEKAKFVYLFECDKGWTNALYKTFEPFKMKVRIINKFVGIWTENENITIDDFVAENRTDITFIKADIEGSEMSMLCGMPNLLKNKDLRLLLCTYHKQNDADEFDAFLKKYGFYTEFSNGHMLFIYDKIGLQEPYFRKGLIRAKKINESK